MLGAVRPAFVVLLALALVASAASWAQQQRPPATNSGGTPTVKCSSQQLGRCEENAKRQCAPTNQSCIVNAITQCNAQCGAGSLE